MLLKYVPSSSFTQFSATDFGLLESHVFLFVLSVSEVDGLRLSPILVSIGGLFLPNLTEPVLYRLCDLSMSSLASLLPCVLWDWCLLFSLLGDLRRAG